MRERKALQRICAMANVYTTYVSVERGIADKYVNQYALGLIIEAGELSLRSCLTCLLANYLRSKHYETITYVNIGSWPRTDSLCDFQRFL